MKKTQLITLECTIDAKCLNCKHMVFGDQDNSFVDLCDITGAAVDEEHYCEEHTLYSFWEDVGLDGVVKRVEE